MKKKKKKKKEKKRKEKTKERDDSNSDSSSSSSSSMPPQFPRSSSRKRRLLEKFARKRRVGKFLGAEDKEELLQANADLRVQLHRERSDADTMKSIERNRAGRKRRRLGAKAAYR